MKFGFILPNNWGIEDPQDVIALGVKAEQLGLDAVWVNQHILHTGEYIVKRLGDRPYYDALTTLTYVAALTRRVRLGTSVLVLPYLNPIVLAKTLATLDVLSGGRLTVGVGTGWLRAESEALGSNFAQRGAYTNEAIAIMKELWTEDAPRFKGRSYSFSGVKFFPKPTQKPHPPILIAGNSPAALRRVARLGDGWHPTSLSLEQLARGMKDLEALASAAGRQMSDITTVARLELDIVDSAAADPARPMVGTPDQVVQSIEACRRLGLHELAFSINTSDLRHIHEVLEVLVEQVLPAAKG